MLATKERACIDAMIMRIVQNRFDDTASRFEERNALALRIVRPYGCHNETLANMMYRGTEGAVGTSPLRSPSCVHERTKIKSSEN